jgi:hypothetical protein
MLTLSKHNTPLKPKLTECKESKHQLRPVLGEWVISSDTEYVQHVNHPNKMICTQLSTSEDRKDCRILEHPSLGIGNYPTWQGPSIFPTALQLTRTNLAPQQYVIIKVLIFFAPADLLAGLFTCDTLIQNVQSHCTQDARITLKVGTGKRPKTYIDTTEVVLLEGIPTGLLLRVCDLGKLAVGGLGATCEGLGVKMQNKKSLDEYKSNMVVPYTMPDLQATFEEYAEDDSCVLFELLAANDARVERIYATHNLPLPKSTPLTTGTLVANLFRTYVNTHLGDNDAYKLFPKTGRAEFDALDDLLSHGNVTHYARISATTAQVNALVQGGRAKNEKPLVHRVSGCLIDTDIAGAYVSKMLQMPYPVGLPSTYSIHERGGNKTPLSLGKFLDKYSDILVPDAYQIIVSGPLTHHQTLVPSKVADPFNVVLQEEYSEDDPKIPADFVLLTREIINGVITHDILQALRAVCTNPEWSEWRNLTVVSAVWYSSKDMYKTPEEWYQAVSIHHEKTGNTVKTKRNKYDNEYHDDERSRAWYPLSIGDFLTPYANERKRLKVLMKGCTKGTPEHTSYDGQQNAMKLVGNVLYGVMASPFFVIGNVVTANNITAGIRTFAWLSAVSLGFNQSITDGGGHDANCARFRDDKMPGMNTLALLHVGNKRLPRQTLERVRIGPLGGGGVWQVCEGFEKSTSIISNGVFTVEGKDGGWSFLDEMCKAHVDNFFRGEDISCLKYFKFEIKDVYSKGVYHGQTNYKFVCADGSEKIKVRGQEIKRQHYSDIDCLQELATKEIAILQLLNALDNNTPQIPAYQVQYKSQVLKMNAANKLRTSKTVDNVYHINGVRAGDSISKRTWVRPLSLSMFHWNTYNQLQVWEKRNLRDKLMYGYGLEGYFIQPDGSVDYNAMVTEIQDSIYDGHNWVKRLDKLKPTPHPYGEHAIQDATIVYELEGYGDESD